jgi:hypothetical protein
LLPPLIFILRAAIFIDAACHGCLILPDFSAFATDAATPPRRYAVFAAYFTPMLSMLSRHFHADSTVFSELAAISP